MVRQWKKRGRGAAKCRRLQRLNSLLRNELDHVRSVQGCRQPGGNTSSTNGSTSSSSTGSHQNRCTSICSHQNRCISITICGHQNRCMYKYGLLYFRASSISPSLRSSDDLLNLVPESQDRYRLDFRKHRDCDELDNHRANMLCSASHCSDSVVYL